jgi:hypothetical protein
VTAPWWQARDKSNTGTLHADGRTAVLGSGTRSLLGHAWTLQLRLPHRRLGFLTTGLPSHSRCVELRSFGAAELRNRLVSRLRLHCGEVKNAREPT